jgi:hypothetical protein
MELFGFWLGFTIALIFLNSLVGLVVIRSDWTHKSDENDDIESEWSLQSALRHHKDPMSPLLNSSFTSFTSIGGTAQTKLIVFSPTGSGGGNMRVSKKNRKVSGDEDDNFFAPKPF